jgi:hypothetical protein
VPPEVTIADAEIESNDVKIGNNGTKRTNRPDSLWNPRRIEAGPNAKSCDRM